MKLIDAGRCPCEKCEDMRCLWACEPPKDCIKFWEWLNRTDYDIELVVGELAHAASEYYRTHGNIAVPYRKAIEIVEAGGVKGENNVRNI